jgi:hypothetical protein
VEQGEGANSHLVHADFRPPKIEAGKEFDPGWFRGELSHYQKFNMLRWHHKHLPEVYEEIQDAKAEGEQKALDETYHSFLGELEKSFCLNSGDMTNEFWNAMFGLSNCIIAVWEKGVRPEFKTQKEI